MPEELVIGVRQELDHVILRLRGWLSLRSIPRIREAAVKSLLDTGRVLIDLSRLRSTQAAFVTVFPTALAVSGGWPSARLVLFGADAALRSMLVSTRVPETVPLAADLPAARMLLEQRPPQVRRHRDLPRHNAAPAAARRFVREACGAWSVPQVVQEIAEVMSSELVSNALRHARPLPGAGIRVGWMLVGDHIEVEVSDGGGETAPTLGTPTRGSLGGRGLNIVDRLSRRWGVKSGPGGMVTVWAEVPFMHDALTEDHPSLVGDRGVIRA